MLCSYELNSREDSIYVTKTNCPGKGGHLKSSNCTSIFHFSEDSSNIKSEMGVQLE
jgi:hypothetical protein